MTVLLVQVKVLIWSQKLLVSGIPYYLIKVSNLWYCFACCNGSKRKANIHTLDDENADEGTQSNKEITSEWEAKIAAYKIFKNVANPEHRYDEAMQPLSRKVPIPSSRMNPYRLVIILRLVILCIFLHYRLTNHVHGAIGLWLICVICEIWFAISWILDQFPKWLPINWETYLDRLALRYDRGEPS